MSGKMPWMQFYPTDWSQDTTPLSLAGRGAWITIVCAMWQSKNRGNLSMSLAGYCRLLGAPAVEVTAAIDELTETGVCENLTLPNKNITLICRRMVREEKYRHANRLRQQRFYKKQQPNADLTNDRSEVRSQKSEVRKREEKKEGTPAESPALQPHFEKPTPEAVMEYGKSINFEIDGQAFVDFYESKGWMIGKNHMKNWRAAVRTWKKRETGNHTLTGTRKASAPGQSHRALYPGEALKMLDELRKQKESLTNRYGSEQNHRMIIRADMRGEHDQLSRKIKEMEIKVRGMG